MSNSLLSVLDPKAIAGLIDRRIPVGFRGLESIFKDSIKPRDNMFTLEFDVRYGRIPRAPMSSPKAPSSPIRVGKVKKLLLEPACIKGHHRVFEADAARMRTPGGLGPYGDKLMADAADTIGKAVQTTKEWMIWQAQRGSITYSNTETGLQFNVNFGQDASHLPVNLTTAKWDAPTTADPLGDIETYIGIIERDGGVTPTAIVMNRFTLAKALKCASLQTVLAPTLKGGSLFAAFKEYLMTAYQCALEIYTGPYESEAGANAYMVNDGEVFFCHPSAVSVESAASEYNKTGPSNYKAGAWTAIEEIKDPLGAKIIGGENSLAALVIPGASVFLTAY